MSVLVFGGSSQIGDFLLPRLRAAGDTVLALSRQPRPSQPGLQWLRGALPRAPQPAPAVDAVFSLGPLAAFVDWLQQVPLAGHPRVLAMSSMSVLSKRESGDPGERATMAALAAAERRLGEVCARRGLDWTILRSTLIYGAGRDRSLTPIARLAARVHMFPLPRGRGLRQPVHADDLAQALLAAARCPSSAGRILALGGGERLPAAEMFARVRAALPVATLPVPLPVPALWLLARVAPSRAAMIARLDADLVADNTEAQALLGISPRPFRPQY